MEDLFWTTLPIDGREADYHIIFEKETYCFLPKDKALSRYCFRRTHDEWQAVDEASEGVKDSAVDALEKYLLKQH